MKAAVPRTSLFMKIGNCAQDNFCLLYEAYYLRYKAKVPQLDLGRHFQLGMLCNFQTFHLMKTFQLDMEQVGY